MDICHKCLSGHRNILELYFTFLGKFDRNINYQQLLQKTDGQKPETINQDEALMQITVPSLIGNYL